MAALKWMLRSTVRLFLGMVVFGALFWGCESEGPPDTIPPAGIVDLAVSGRSTCSIDLSWTATGDDGLEGRAAAYDLRFSTTPITEASWAEATQCQGELTPANVGELEHLTVGNLTARTRYYFRCVAVDDDGNSSPLSNSATSETDSAGTLPGVAWVNDGLGPEDREWTNSAGELSATWASVGGATGYEYAIGTARASTNLLNWRSATSADQTSVTCHDLSLVEGTDYYFSVRALLDGGCSGYGFSDGVTVDWTAPAAHVRTLSEVARGFGIKLVWTGSDNLSGISAYDVQSKDGEAGTWTDLMIGVSDTTAVFEATDGHTYFFRARARDGAGNQAEYRAAADAQTLFLFGAAEVAWVKDGLGTEDADFTASTSELSATWASVDGADGYQYAIGTERGSTDILGWTPAGTDTSVTRSGLNLNGCRQYFFQVRAVKGAEVSVATSSDGIAVDTVPPSSFVLALPDTIRGANTGGLGWITIYWTGVDRQSGINHYDVQYSMGDGVWEDAITGTTRTSTTIMAGAGTHYSFRCRAVDNVGNVERYSGADAQTYFTFGNQGPPPPPPPPPSPYTLKIALHLAAHGSTTCKNPPVINSRSEMVRRWSAPGTDLDVVAVVFAYDSLSSFEYGLIWPAEWGSGATTVCPGPLVAGVIENPGDGLSIVWESCKVSGESPAFLPVAWTWLAPNTNGMIWVTTNPLFPDRLGGADCRNPIEDRTYHYPDSIFCAAVGLDPYEGIWCGAAAMSCIRALFK